MVGSIDKQNRKRPVKIVVLAIVYIVAGAAIAISLTSIWSTLQKWGPLAAKSQNGSLLTLLFFLGVVTLLTMAVPAELWERQRAQEKEQFPAENDPLIELENRRELLDSLEMEIKRSNRSQRPFAFLRLQVDGLERINSEHGQRVSDRAICWLAQVLQTSCRELDTVVRYGGDEFAIVIPEAGPETVRQVMRRIRERFAGAPELPPLTVGIGAAMFGEDGRSINSLLEAADRELYDVKRTVNLQAGLCA
jgi:diguanylate cyclase (GGDEF)-like protein